MTRRMGIDVMECCMGSNKLGADSLAEEYLVHGKDLLASGQKQAGIEAIAHAMDTCKPCLKFTYLKICSQCEIAAGCLTEASVHMNEADTLGPLSAEELFMLALLISKEDAETAVVLFDRAASLDAKDPDIEMHRGACKLVLGDFQGCIEDQNAALQLGQDNAVVCLCLAKAYMRMGDNLSALADVTRIILAAHSDFQLRREALTLRIDIKRQLGELKTAIGDLKGAVVGLKGAVADLAQADTLQPLSDTEQHLRQDLVTELQAIA